MKMGLRFISFSCLFMLMLSYQNVQAQQNLAQQAYAIFDQSCLICHGEKGSYTEALIIEHTALIDDGKVIPGDPDGSVFYQRLIETDVARRMPQGQPPLDPAAIETIRQWILAGAPDWDAVPRPDTNFITTDTMLETIENHVNSLSSSDRSFARYFTLTHLYNAGETTEALNAYRRALSKLINSLSWGRNVVKPMPIDVKETIYYIDLRDYEWDVRNEAWTQIEQLYPYQMTFDAPIQTLLRDKLTTLQQEMSCDVPFVHMDWFLATASLPPLYHDILALPNTDRELEEELDVYVVDNLQNAAGKRVWRAGFNESGVSRHNRVVERHTSSYGAYWKSYDFAGSAESQNIFTHPLDFAHDGGEIIFNLPNGLQAYYLVDANGGRLDVAPTDIVSNPAVSDPAVRNGLSCIGCHTEGMKIFEDEVRAVVEQAVNPPFNKTRALELYVEQKVMNGLVEEDTIRYRNALEAAGGVFGGIEPIQRFYEVFHGSLGAAHAAAVVGLETDVFLEKISQNVSLQNLLGVLVLENGTVKRDAWTSNFDAVIDALNTPDSGLPPVVERPERIPGAGVYIPDANLRAAIAEALGKAASDAISEEEMATLTDLNFVNMGIHDITGLEFATNLRELNFEANKVSDLSPVTGLSELKVLNIVNNQISDLSPIAELKEMNYLVINHNPISDISAISGLTQLEYLQMSHIAGVSDISPLTGLINLTTFHCWGSPITDMSPLVNLPKLEILDLCGAKLTNIPSLDNLKSLKTLYLVDCNISDVKPLSSLAGLEHFTKLNLHRNNMLSNIIALAALTQLKWLDLSWNNISDISPLAELTNLEWLNLTKNSITDFSPLAELAQTTNILTGEVAIPDRNLRAAIADALDKGDTAVVSITAEEMTTLQRFDAPNKNISDLTGLEFAKNLTYIYIPYNPLSDISPLASLTKLRQIQLSDTEVADLSPLASLSNLEDINVSETRVSSLAPLAGLKKLQKLATVHSDISDLSPLAGLTNLTRLRLYDCKATDLSPLKNLTKLKWLGLTHTDHILDLSPLSGLTDLEHLALSDTEISDLTPLAGLVNLQALILNENRIVDVSPLASLRNLKNLQLHENNISDFSPLAGIRETIEVFTWFGNPAFPQGGPNIEGPWLWLTLPVIADKDVDYLAKASNNKSTEQQVATLGASEGTVIGNSAWSVGMLEPYHPDDSKGNKTNLRRLLDSQDAIAPNIHGQKFVVYGSMTLYSPKIQQTKIFIGASVGQKIYLNGKLVHQDYTDYAFGAHNVGYRTFFPVTLQKGINILLVRLDELTAHNDLWSLFIGFEPDTEYMTGGFSFSATGTANLFAGDAFTLNLNAENITDLAGWQTDIAFDPNVLEAVEVTEGDFLKSEGADTFFGGGTIDNAVGKIAGIFSARQSEVGASGAGALLTVTFMAKLSGESEITLENFEFGSITGDIIPVVPPIITITVGDYPAWDVNQDGRVSILDLILVAQDFGSDAPTNLRTDVNRDGVVNIQDLIIVAQHFGETTDSAAPSFVANELTPAMVKAWINQAQVEDDGSVAFRQGIENLQRLLASLIPKKTVLLANYPNPFNPETWIPYHLAKAADITLTIYATNGAVVRTLALGHQDAGIYQSRSRAAYWDGTNDIGERVGSGLYFYQLQVDNMSYLRKMVILK